MNPTNDAPNTSSNTSAADAQHAAVARLVADLGELGTQWARYGLSMGRLALETSARTLGTTARLLGDLAEALPGKADAQEVEATVVIEVPRTPEA